MPDTETAVGTDSVTTAIASSTVDTAGTDAAGTDTALTTAGDTASAPARDTPAAPAGTPTRSIFVPALLIAIGLAVLIVLFRVSK